MMPQDRDEAQLETTAECTLEKGLAGLQQAAAELGANAVAVLIADAARIELAYPRRAELACPPHLRCELTSQPGPFHSHSSIACYLKSVVASEANSFLLFPWRASTRVVIILFGFAGAQPNHRAIPDRVVDNLNLAALAAWSVKEASRLRRELRVVNHHLANRKTVERAKSLLQSERGLTEPQAYELLRKMSRQRRITIAKLAEDLVGNGTGRPLN